MKLPRIWILFSVGLLSFFIFFFFLSIYLFIIGTRTSESPKSEEKLLPKRESYLYQEFDSSSNDISRGFITLRESLPDDDFISYTSPNGNQIIISNFATSQFECVGSCFCSSEKRRTSSNILSRPLFLIISAISTSLALKIAEKTFHNQCLLQFSSECDEEDIQSSVSSCSEKEEKESTEEEEFAEYSCEGYCIKNKRIRAPDGLVAQKEYLFETGGCENLKTFGSVKLERKINEKAKRKGRALKRTGEVKEYPSRYKNMYDKALYKFSKDYLTSFCKEMSQEEYYWHSPTTKKRYRQKAFMCVGGARGGDLPDERLDYPFQNVKCVMTSESKQPEFVRELNKKLVGRRVE